MASDGYTEFFVAAAGASGALTGLLFVAVSVIPHQVRGISAAAEDRVRASTALTTLASPFVIALVGLLPGTGLSVIALIVGAGGVLLSILSGVRISRSRLRGIALMWEWIAIAGALAIAAVEVSSGIVLVSAPEAPDALKAVATAIIASLVLGVNRAWSLVGEPGDGVVPRLGSLAGLAARAGAGTTAERRTEPSADGSSQAQSTEKSGSNADPS